MAKLLCAVHPNAGVRIAYQRCLCRLIDISEGMYDPAAKRKVQCEERPGCQCTSRSFIPEFGDKATPEIRKLLKEAAA